MTTGVIFDLRRFSIQDGPGIRTTIFLKGCPLSCWWCHNPESQKRSPQKIFRPARCIACGACVEACPQQGITPGPQGFVTDPEKCTACGECAEVCFAEACEIAGREITPADVLAELLRDETFYDESCGGVTFSGGEPLLQPDFLLETLQICKAAGLHTAVDTSGFAPWSVFERLLPFTDLFLYDLKLVDEQRHRQYTGVSNRVILNNLERLSAINHPFQVRIPVIPGINDNETNLRDSARLLTGLTGLRRLDLLPYHAAAQAKYERLGLPYLLPDTQTPDEVRMLTLAEYFRTFDLPVHIGG